MPRGRGNTYYKPSRETIISGATIITRPSGVTVKKNSIETTGVTITASSLQSSYGFPCNIGTAGVKVLSGITKSKGVSNHWTATNLGLSSITNVILNAGNATGTMFMNLVKIDNTEATVHYYMASGATKTAGGTSIQYFFIGT